jgi:small subunit ribosomal protein S4
MRGPKEKKERSLGTHLYVKGTRCTSPKCAFARKPHRPGAHGHSRKRKALSEFGLQIREKQKFKISYGINERNLRRIFTEAKNAEGSLVDQFLSLLERRLDNVVFRLGIAPSRSMARQLVGHGHIFVNGRRVRSGGYQVKPNDVITVRAESHKLSAFRTLGEALKNFDPPSWLSLDKTKLEGRVLSVPQDLLPPFEVNLLVESFSK